MQNLCFFSFFKNHFLLKIIFWLLRSIWLPRVHCILVLFWLNLVKKIIKGISLQIFLLTNKYFTQTFFFTNKFFFPKIIDRLTKLLQWIQLHGIHRILFMFLLFSILRIIQRDYRASAGFEELIGIVTWEVQRNEYHTDDWWGKDQSGEGRPPHVRWRWKWWGRELPGCTGVSHCREGYVFFY